MTKQYQDFIFANVLKKEKLKYHIDIYIQTQYLVEAS